MFLAEAKLVGWEYVENNKGQTGCILLDFSKAFDYVGFSQTIIVIIEVLWNH